MSVHRKPQRSARLYELDLLRLGAAISVMIYHYTCRDQQLPEEQAARQFYPELHSYSNYGYLGVHLFFAISGFVILMSAWGRRPGDFALSRFVRLFPAYWFSVLVVLAVFLSTGLFWTIPGEQSSPLQEFIPNLTMLQRGIKVPDLDGVYWTLWIELHFYALVAPLLWWGLTYRRCLLFMAGWLLVSVYAQEARFSMLTSLLVPKYAPWFVAGMAFYLIYKYGSNLVPWTFVGVCWALRCHYGYDIAGGPRAIDGYRLVVPVLTTLIFVVMALVATHRLSWLRWKGCVVLGALTYPLYLFHKVVAILLFHWLGSRLDRWEFLAVATCVSLVVAYLVYRLVELPAQRWLRPRLAAALEQIRVVSEGGERAEPATAPATAVGQVRAVVPAHAGDLPHAGDSAHAADPAHAGDQARTVSAGRS